jgi:hypothetical protein
LLTTTKTTTDRSGAGARREAGGPYADAPE